MQLCYIGFPGPVAKAKTLPLKMGLEKSFIWSLKHSEQKTISAPFSHAPFQNGDGCTGYRLNVCWRCLLCVWQIQIYVSFAKLQEDSWNATCTSFEFSNLPSMFKAACRSQGVGLSSLENLCGGGGLAHFTVGCSRIYTPACLSCVASLVKITQRHGRATYVPCHQNHLMSCLGWFTLKNKL